MELHTKISEVNTKLNKLNEYTFTEAMGLIYEHILYTEKHDKNIVDSSLKSGHDDYLIWLKRIKEQFPIECGMMEQIRELNDELSELNDELDKLDSCNEKARRIMDNIIMAKAFRKKASIGTNDGDDTHSDLSESKTFAKAMSLIEEENLTTNGLSNNIVDSSLEFDQGKYLS